MAHSLFENRPDRLAYRAKDGIYTTYLPSPEAQATDFNYFVDRTIAWSDQAVDSGGRNYGYSVLDTFMADFLAPSHFESMLRRVSAEAPLRVLLVDPYSAFGEARAAAIADGSAEDRARTGISVLVNAIENFRGRDAKGLARASYESLLARLNAGIHDFDIPMEIRYYGVIPSGPMLFLKDLLIAGSYSVNLSSMRLPWEMIVDDQATLIDRFDVCRTEFESIWGDYSVSVPGAADEQSNATMRVASRARDHAYFISYHQGTDVTVADHVEVLLHRQGKRVIRDEFSLDIGSRFENVLPFLIETSGTFVALFSEQYVNSPYCMGELQAAIDQTARIGVPRLAIMLLADDADLGEKLPIRVRNRLTAQGHSRSAREHTIMKLVEQELNSPPEGAAARNLA
jgi:hypothetical protein